MRGEGKGVGVEDGGWGGWWCLFQIGSAFISVNAPWPSGGPLWWRVAATDDLNR